MHVIDASVIAKWYIVEEDTDKALYIRNKYISGDIKITLPDLTILELANAIRFKKNSTLQDVKDVLDNFNKLQFKIIEVTIDLVQKASEFSYDYNISIYDALYITLADKIGYEFITADEKLYKKVNNFKNIKLLKHFDIS